MNCLIVLFIAFAITEIASQNIIRKIDDYFNSNAVGSFKKQWNQHKISFENIIDLALQEGYGHKAMNVLINRPSDPLKILSKGYYHTDNQVQIIFQTMELNELPHLHDTQVSFPLASNALLIEASVSKMIVHTKYIAFRNKSDIIYATADQNSFESSPFRFQQVQNLGDLAITIEGCILSGLIMATLNGHTVSLGHNQLRLSECQYSFEIYGRGMGAPPVIAHYLPKGKEGLNIEHLLVRPLLDELMPKIQATIFTYINASSSFIGLPEIRVKQNKIFDETKQYIDEVVRNMNKKTTERNMGTIEMNDFSITWDDKFEQIPNATAISLYKMTLVGLDTVYSAHIGGPYKLTETEISEQLRFSSLKVIGNIEFEGEFQTHNEFAVEISDLAVDVTLDANLKNKFEVVGWRSLEFSCPKMEFLQMECVVTGYLLSEIPRHIISHLRSVFNSHGTVSDVKVLNEDANNFADVKEPGSENNSNQDIMEHIEQDEHLNENGEDLMDKSSKIIEQDEYLNENGEDLMDNISENIEPTEHLNVNGEDLMDKSSENIEPNEHLDENGDMHTGKEFSEPMFYKNMFSNNNNNNQAPVNDENDNVDRNETQNEEISSEIIEQDEHLNENGEDLMDNISENIEPNEHLNVNGEDSMDKISENIEQVEHLNENGDMHIGKEFNEPMFSKNMFSNNNNNNQESVNGENDSVDRNEAQNEEIYSKKDDQAPQISLNEQDDSANDVSQSGDVDKKIKLIGVLHNDNDDTLETHQEPYKVKGPENILKRRNRPSLRHATTTSKSIHMSDNEIHSE